MQNVENHSSVYHNSNTNLEIESNQQTEHQEPDSIKDGHLTNIEMQPTYIDSEPQHHIMQNEEHDFYNYNNNA